MSPTLVAARRLSWWSSSYWHWCMMGTYGKETRESPLIGILLSPIHRCPSCTNANNCLTTMVTCVLRPKWGTFSIINKPAFSKPAAHCFTSSNVAPVSGYLTECKYVPGVNYGNFPRSFVSWSAYLSRSIFPVIVPTNCTPGGSEGVRNVNFFVC